jgi:excinuclease ABC subunit A
MQNSKLDFDKLDAKRNILIKGARQHNLKNIDVIIPRNAFTVITGVSGSGKSTLAFDTLYAEGQRRYVESLSSYARQFLSRLDKPEVDFIKGISPAIAIEQKVISKNSRSSVGTTTEIYDYLKVLFARLGKIISPITGKEVVIQSIDDIVKSLLAYVGKKAIVFVPAKFLGNREISDLIADGYSRARKNGEFCTLESLKKKDKGQFDLVIDRIKVADDEDFISALKDSIEDVYLMTEGYCAVDVWKGEEIVTLNFSEHIEEDGVVYEEPHVNLFNHNSPTGACPTCEGFGQTLGISESLVVPDVTKSVYEGAVACWNTPNQVKWKDNFIKVSAQTEFPIHRAYRELDKDEKAMLWSGAEGVEGINAFFAHKQKKIYKIQNRVLLSKYKGRALCPECKGAKLKKEALYVKIQGSTIADVASLSIQQTHDWILTLKFKGDDFKIAERLVAEITNRLEFLINVGVPYITLDRAASTLSGGESQRINLASSLGSSLVGALYVLDEPSIGLHPKDTQKLIKVLKQLNQLGNTVVVVEHDEDIIRSASYLIDIGPLAGTLGGELVYQGKVPEMLTSNSLTANYLNGTLKVGKVGKGVTSKKSIKLKHAYLNNLKIDEVSFPLNTLTVVMGMSGSGKSTLLLQELAPEVRSYLNSGTTSKLTGDLELIQHLEYVNQNPIGRSSRSNPVTYIKAYDDIRALFSAQPMSKLRGYKPGFFSLNVPGGRCENCQGEGQVTVEMQFMADLKIKCTECEGKKFKDEILEVQYQGLSIGDVLDLTVEDAIDVFTKVEKTNKASFEKKIIAKMSPLKAVGLSYIKLGQASSTLSGGEAQRVKLAFFLIKGNVQKHTLFIFDEPTTGLHFHDVNQLLNSFTELIEQGHTVIVIEHNMDVAKCADHLIELGPEGGDKGGEISFEGNPRRYFGS